MANFLLKFGKFSLPWQQGSSEQSLTDTISAFPIDFAGRPYNTLTLPCERVIHPELWQVSCLNFEIFVTMVTGVGVIQILFAQLNSPTLKTPYYVQASGP